jgi:hypothetical protein
VRDSTVSNPTWSPDSRQIAYADKDGVWIENVPPAFDGQCSGMDERLLVAGEIEPDWGPADVNMHDAPTFTHPTGGGTPTQSGGTGGNKPAPGSKPRTRRRPAKRCVKSRKHRRRHRPQPCTKPHRKHARHH